MPDFTGRLAAQDATRSVGQRWTTEGRKRRFKSCPVNINEGTAMTDLGWRGRAVAVVGTSIVGMVLGNPEQGIATVFVRSKGLAYRVGVEALQLRDSDPARVL